ncbi:MAG: hypothetical protein ABI543_07365 [Ignavibacteria bacterium]
MSIEIARYQFHSWARRGLSSSIPPNDDLGTGSSTAIERAEIPVSVKVNSDQVSKNFTLIGPGDIIGVNRNMVIRTEPISWITDFEPNYLAFVEFYDEDFPWRYTPAGPQGEKLRPWLYLFVLKEDEFERTKQQSPLPSIMIKKKEAYPPHLDTWLWAHVHSNADIPSSELSNIEEFLLSLNKTVNDDPDKIFSRLMSPRKLEENTPYYAFVVPAFETGRLAGLTLPTEGINAQLSSWDDTTEEKEFPVYYEWFFRTGTNVDFEYLVKLLEPRAMDPKIGIRDMDCSKPGFVKADGTGEIPGTKPDLIGLEGALKSPSTVSTVFPDPPDEMQFQIELENIVNLPITAAANITEDPIITVPFYGVNHARQIKTDQILLDIDNDKWLHDLNKDPRSRVSSGFGTLVIQKNQESYMKKAWSQVEKILEANRKILETKFTMAVGIKYTQKFFSKVEETKLIAISHPVHKKVMGSPTTIYHQINESKLPSAVFSGAFRRLMRPNGANMRKLDTAGTFKYEKLVNNINDGLLTAAPPKTTPGSLPSIEGLIEKAFPVNLPGWIKWLLKNSMWIIILLIVLFLILAFVSGMMLLFIGLAVVTTASYLLVKNAKMKTEAKDILTDSTKTLEAFYNASPKPDFTLKLDEDNAVLIPTKLSGGSDSLEAKNFRKAAIDLSLRLTIKAPEKVYKNLDLKNSYLKLSKAIHPETSFPLKLVSLVKFPGYIKLNEPEYINPAMAYPDFEDPMYKKLVDISSELLIPNLKLIPENTISLLKTNQKFIESYLVGLNHEMGRELLWREYPTDQRGSYFRQFWDVKGVIIPNTGKTEAEVTEEYKDIKPIHTWSKTSYLGRHNNRDKEGDAEQTVLMIRGDLFKHYPNTVIYAQKAVAGDKPDDLPKINLELTDEQFAKEIKFPLYRAEVKPDVKFFGFDLTILQAKGDELTDGFTDNLGWFFIIQEVPGEPRFGMDINYNAGTDGVSWDDLAWDKFTDEVKFIKSGIRPAGFHPTDNSPDKWGVNSANMAYVLFQKPVMVAVHSKDMLGKI